MDKFHKHALYEIRQIVARAITVWEQRCGEEKKAPFPLDTPCYYCQFNDGQSDIACNYCIHNPEAVIYKLD